MPFPTTPLPVRQEFHQLHRIEERLADPLSSWHDVVLQDVDLRAIDDPLSQRDLAGCFFLGCELGPQVSRKIAESELHADPARRCLVFPRMTQFPYNPYRSTLYDPIELVGDFPSDDPEVCRQIYEASIDWQSYSRIAETNPLAETEIPKCKSIGIPTWHYGHEPPNPFATHIAKYFDNSVREEGLLAIADGGVIFAPGNAGTVQEIFQDACQNYYQTYGPSAPMILFNSDYWNPPVMSDEPDDRRKQVYPLLKKLASEKGFAEKVLITDSLGEIVRQITGL